MKPFKRIKIINGIEYIYQITPYYDPKTKRVRQKSTYLGKNQDGNPVRVREKKVKDVFSYGEFLPVEKVITDYKLDRFFEKELGKVRSKTVLALSYGRVIRGLAMQNMADWYESTWPYHHTRDLPLSSGGISRLLTEIGQSRLQDKLASYLVRQLESRRTILYDITSVTSYSELIKLLEWGYNRDHNNLPQINLSVILDKQEGIPLSYEIYPGSITDVQTLFNTIKKLSAIGIKYFTIILDRGFYSLENINHLIEANADFVIAVPQKYKEVNQLMSRVWKEIDHTQYLEKYGGDIFFVKEVDIVAGTHTLKGFCYYNPGRATQEKDNFYRKLVDIKKELEKLTVDKSVRRQAAEIAGKHFEYFSLDTTSAKLKVTIKDKAVSRVLNKKGLYLIAYRGDYDWECCLAAYKEKDLIERGFNILKNDLELSTPGVHKNETLKGIVFINLLALIIRMKIMNILKQAELTKEYSFEKMLLQLEKIKAVVYDNGKVIITELTKKQKEILEAFNAVPNI